MATATNPTADNAYLDILGQALRNSNLSAEQQQQLWLQASALPNNACNNFQPQPLAGHIPRSMSAYSTPSITQTSTPDPNSMDRTHSAPAFAPMGRTLFSTSANLSNNNSMAQRSASSLPTWQTSTEEQNSGYTLYSQSASMRRQSSLHPINEASPFSNGGMVEYDPAEYISSCIEPPSASSLILPLDTSSGLQVSQLTQDQQWSPSLDGSISPSTPPASVMTPVTISSSNMSRQSSCNPQLVDTISMLRVQSDSSSIFPPVLSEDGFSFSYDVDAKNISSSVDTSFFPTFTGLSSDVFPSHAHVSPSVSALGSYQQEPYLAEDMQRSASSSSESDASYVSTSSTSSRQTRREREINAQASRKIAPKAIENNDETKSASSNVQMKRVLSEDGSSKDVAQITKAPYVRPQHPKIQCHFCDARPEGFRGTHELDRHIARAHAKIRKGYICVDFSQDKKFLANCKHCRNKKVYGAYYNAAAHLRRAHFYPRKRGRKGKNDEKRGGIGGGDDPPMDHLKQHWIKEIEMAGGEKRLKQSAKESFPDDVADSSPIDASDTADSFDYECIDASYPAQLTTDVPNMLDYNQCMDPSVFMNTNDASYDSIPQLVTYNDPNMSTTHINDFQFDAYVTH